MILKLKNHFAFNQPIRFWNSRLHLFINILLPTPPIFLTSLLAR